MRFLIVELVVRIAFINLGQLPVDVLACTS